MRLIWAEVAARLVSTKLWIAVMVWAAATALLVTKYITEGVWLDISQTVLLGYFVADVATQGPLKDKLARLTERYSRRDSPVAEPHDREA